MAQSQADRSVAICSSCGEIHTVEVRRDGSMLLLGRGLVDRCPCGDGELERVHVNLETPPSAD